MTLYLSRSHGRKAFKSLLGNANHLIITALVGLDGIERGVVREVPEDLRTVWSPKDAVNSAKRSRRLILDMALIRAIDAIDTYLRDALRKPTLVQAISFQRDLDSSGLSVFRKLQVVERHCRQLDPIPLAIAFLMVAWRNRSAHSEADLDAPQTHLNVLRSNKGTLATRFSGLDAEMLLAGYDAARPVTFKEIASLINAAHHLVSELDTLLLKSLDIERYMKDIVWVSLVKSQKPGELASRTRMRHAVSIWGKDPSDRGDAVLRFLSQLGFSRTQTENETKVVVPLDLIEMLKQQTPKSILAWANVDG